MELFVNCFGKIPPQILDNMVNPYTGTPQIILLGKSLQRNHPNIPIWQIPTGILYKIKSRRSFGRTLSSLKGAWQKFLGPPSGWDTSWGKDTRGPFQRVPADKVFLLCPRLLASPDREDLAELEERGHPLRQDPAHDRHLSMCGVEFQSLSQSRETKPFNL